MPDPSKPTVRLSDLESESFAPQFEVTLPAETDANALQEFRQRFERASKSGGDSPILLHMSALSREN